MLVDIGIFIKFFVKTFKNQMSINREWAPTLKGAYASLGECLPSLLLHSFTSPFMI